MRNIWLDGIMGVVVGDALGVPVEFKTREELEETPVVDMRGYGTYNLPKGSWSDDSSMTLATLESIKQCGLNLQDMMEQFVKWFKNGEYTPYGKVFDIGITCQRAISDYSKTKDVSSSGATGEADNGNGSLMRILPVCLYIYEKQRSGNISTDEALQAIHKVSALTHGHMRSKIACGLYYFMVKNVLDREGDLVARLQDGINEGFAYYQSDFSNLQELKYYNRIKDLEKLEKADVSTISSSGYVVATMEAAVWSLINTKSYGECVLKAVNLGSDTDTVAAIAGGIAGLYYGYERIPKECLNVIVKREWIEDMIIKNS